MSNCCEIEVKNNDMRKVLWITLWINLIVFFGQFTAAIISHSSSLLADSIDMLGDVFAYAISIYAFNRGERWGARAALIKGVIIALFACFVFIDVVKKILFIEPYPAFDLMLIFSFIGLIANGICLWLLTAFRDENINMQSVWICSRNDILVNLSVIVTAILVYLFKSQWPDIIVGLSLALVLISSGYNIVRLSLAKLSHLKEKP